MARGCPDRACFRLSQIWTARIVEQSEVTLLLALAFQRSLSHFPGVDTGFVEDGLCCFPAGAQLRVGAPGTFNVRRIEIVVRLIAIILHVVSVFPPPVSAGLVGAQC
jgi:hypothetical protein